MVQNAGEEKKIFVFVEGKKGEVFYLPVRHGKQHINFSGFDHRIDKASNTVLIFDSSFLSMVTVGSWYLEEDTKPAQNRKYFYNGFELINTLRASTLRT